MRTVFADTFYWVALANPYDEWHQKAREVSESLAPFTIVTTDEVLVEFLNFYKDRRQDLRRAAVRHVKAVLSHPGIRVIEQSRSSFLSGVALYEERSDKQYSLTDCIAMATMRAHGVIEVLTHDHHFAQEGFAILLTNEGK